MDIACSKHKEKGYSCGVFVGKLGGETPVGKPRRGCKNNIKIDLGEMRWIYLVQDRG
jgi:hypothetical protein